MNLSVVFYLVLRILHFMVALFHVVECDISSTSSLSSCFVFLFSAYSLNLSVIISLTFNTVLKPELCKFICPLFPCMDSLCWVYVLLFDGSLRLTSLDRVERRLGLGRMVFSCTWSKEKCLYILVFWIYDCSYFSYT